MCVTDRRDMTLAVTLALNPATTTTRVKLVGNLFYHWQLLFY